MSQRTVLFLCTGNSCRSQMAEALINHKLGKRWQAFSAGTRPAGFVHPLALKVLAEIGIEHQGRSKSVEEFYQRPFDLVITVCDDAAETCPVWPGAGRRVHFRFRDPARVQGTESEQLSAFRSVRDEISQTIEGFLQMHSA